MRRLSEGILLEAVINRAGDRQRPERLKMRISKESPFAHPRLVVRCMARLDHTKTPKITTNNHGCLDIKNTMPNVISNVSVTPIQANEGC